MLRLLAFACTLTALIAAGPASAATFTVTKTADTADGVCDADCSLREAVSAADDNETADVVVLPAGTYVLTAGALQPTESLTVAGAGARTTTIQGDGSDRVLHLGGGRQDAYEITGVTVTGGGGVTLGAGVLAEAALTLRDAAVVGNATSQPGSTSGRLGAGLYLGQNATLERVLVAGNTAASVAGDSFSPQGAGIYVGKSATLVNVTVAGNTLDGTLGGSFGPQGAGIYLSFGETSLTNVTVAGNSVVDADGQAGGIYVNDIATFARTIVAGNTVGATTDECFAESFAAVTSAAINLATNAADCGFTAPADLSADPLLAPLADNGGTTDTRAPAAGSPAIDRAPFADCPTLDQRGFARAGAGAACDLGAHEAGAPASPPAPPPATPTATPTSTPTPPPAPAPLKATAVFTLPSAKSCVSRRGFTIRIRKRKGITFTSATVLVNGKRVRAVKGLRLTAPINLKGLPKGRFTVKITAFATDGRKVTGVRRYRTCTPKSKPRTRSPRL